ncbi:MAG: hypothetical protein QOF78_732 [Phycisphaerales bacterium]|jgi:hypothetical protein|nr:hypothetical protein [Phycisphaerales bacterium]
MNNPPRERPRLGASEMARVGVTIIDHARVVLQCDICETQWQPSLDAAGARTVGFFSRTAPRDVLPPDYFKCPRGCNHGAKLGIRECD